MVWPSSRCSRWRGHLARVPMTRHVALASSRLFCFLRAPLLVGFVVTNCANDAAIVALASSRLFCFLWAPLLAAFVVMDRANGVAHAMGMAAI